MNGLNFENTVMDAFEDFLNSIEGQSPASQKNYRRRLKNFLLEVGMKLPSELKRSDVNRWHNDLLAESFAEATNSGYIQAIKAFGRWLHRNGHTHEDITSQLKYGSFISKRNKVPDEEGVKAITRVALRYIDDDSSKPSEILKSCAWLLAVESGGRLGELVNIRFSEMKECLEKGSNNAEIYLVRSHRKTKEVELEFSEWSAKGLKRWLKVRPKCKRDRFFVTSKRTKRGGRPMDYYPMSKRGFQSMLARLAKEAGIRPIYPHTLRHRVGHLTTQEFSPKVAQMKLNHKDVKTVLDFYHHPSREDVNRATMALMPDM